MDSETKEIRLTIAGHVRARHVFQDDDRKHKPQILVLNPGPQIAFLSPLSQGTYLVVVGRKLCSRRMLWVWLGCG